MDVLIKILKIAADMFDVSSIAKRDKDFKKLRMIKKLYRKMNKIGKKLERDKIPEFVAKAELERIENTITALYEHISDED